MKKFSELGLSKPVLIALEQSGYAEPTEIQQETISHILAGRHILASAQTGSGKTAAFALPVLERLQKSDKKTKALTKALVVVPTRELALQVEEQFKRFAKHSHHRSIALYGGTGYGKQISALQRGADIIVATPGRLLDCVERKFASLSNIEMLVLDEADRLLDMGFMPQIRKIIAQLPKNRQTIMFSATFDKRIEKIAAEYLVDPIRVQVNADQIQPATIEQRLYHINEFGKDKLLVQLIEDLKMSSVLVFTRTRKKAAWVRARLRDSNVLAEEIHSDISQSKRERTLNRYREGKFPVLVATDIAARGLDIPSITHVINYDLPEKSEDYVHRIGRTGRAGRSGVALSFVCAEQSYLIRGIEKLIGFQLDPNAPAPKPSHSLKRARSSRRFRPSKSRRAV